MVKANRVRVRFRVVVRVRLRAKCVNPCQIHKLQYGPRVGVRAQGPGLGLKGEG